MNLTTALALAFLQGRVLSIKTAFKEFGVTNLPREASRLIEKKFNVELKRVRREGISKYGVPIYWYEYRLPSTVYNAEGRKKMVEYVQKHSPTINEARTNKELSIANTVKQLNLL
jgi:hypothetical protein